MLQSGLVASTLYFNAFNYYLIDVAILTDTRCGHMVFLSKLYVTD